MLNTKLIFVEGLPGLGKTTTSVWLARRLHALGVPVNLLEEAQPNHPLNVGGALHPAGDTPGEAFFQSRETTFKQVVLVPWPSPGIYRIGFVAARASASVRRHLGDDIEVVFLPHTPNPASGFVHYVPRAQLIYLDWAVEEALKVIVSGGVLQPGDLPLSVARAAASAPAPSVEGPGGPG